MKRKQAMTFNPGGTRSFLSAEDINRLQTGQFASSVRPNNGVNVYGATDLSYQCYGNSFARSFRKQFGILSDKINNWDCAIQPLGKLYETPNSPSREVWYFYGWRIVVEFFDVNAIVDFTNAIDEDADLLNCQAQFLAMYSGDFAVKLLNDHLINVTTL